jgi:mannitol/fructose-specific phosphotransferase system IIA component (Ntr-type)
MRSILTALQEGRLFELPECNKAKALEFLARILDANPDIEVGTDTIEEIKHREQECNTGIGMGVGVPHVRARREEGELFCAIGWSTQGIEYGAGDDKAVHLVVMYYIPGAQKNVYLKEISSLVKAIRKAGGMEQIAHAADLNEVRNLLLDFVSSVSGEAGPEAVARMIKLEVRQAQAPQPVPVPVVAVPPELAAICVRKGPRVHTLSVLITPSQPTIVLSQEQELSLALEKTPSLAHSLAEGLVIQVNGHQVYTTSVTAYAQGRILYQCVALPT